ncbi:hypothetical protein C2845_PM11G01130 [Panicum miliaceum]|uniref:Uncharacterized protein n=1 Tax=Panicum miliaceum TaxID=4540 RepID=A0A3L6RPX6_PANMI|nr:hypothetical protein C2845_PM11G01130 [Panicum miliaceum]
MAIRGGDSGQRVPSPWAPWSAVRGQASGSGAPCDNGDEELEEDVEELASSGGSPARATTIPRVTKLAPAGHGEHQRWRAPGVFVRDARRGRPPLGTTSVPQKLLDRWNAAAGAFARSSTCTYAVAGAQRRRPHSA